MKWLCTLLMLCISVPVMAQNAIMDSLRLQLTQIDSTDTDYVRTSLNLAFQLRNINRDSARILCIQAQRQLPHIADEITLVKAMRQLGNVYYRIKELDRSLDILNKGMELAKTNGFKQEEAFLLNNLGSTYRAKKNFERALDYYEKSLKMNKALDNKGGQTVAINNLGNVYGEDKKDYETAIKYYKQALSIQEEVGNKTYQAGISHNIALNYSRMGDYKNVVFHYKQAARLYRETKNINGELKTQKSLGRYQEKHGDFGGALRSYQGVLKMRQSLNDTLGEVSTLIDIGNLYLDFEEYKNSYDYWNKALELARNLESENTSAIILNNLGRNLIFTQNYENALKYLHKSLSIHRKEKSEWNIPYPLYNIGSTYEKLNQLDSAQFYLDQALTLSRKEDNLLIQTLALADQAKILKKQGKIDAAIDKLVSAFYLSKPKKYLPEKVIISEELYQLYKQKNNSAQALKFHEQFKILQDSLFNEENTKQLAILEATYQFEQEKQQLEAQQKDAIKEERISRRNALIALGVAGVFILTLVLFARAKQITNRKTLHQKAIIEKQNEQLKISQAKLKELDQAKSRLYTNITHEFRTPLTVILGVAEQLESAEKKNNSIRQKLALIRRNGSNLLELINQILDLSKLESNELKINYVLADIVKYVGYITESFHSLANSQNILLLVESKQAEIEMDYDTEKMRQILSNLLSNAIKYTSSGGKVVVTINKIQSVDDSRQSAVGGRRSAVGSQHNSANSTLNSITDEALSQHQLPTADCLLLSITDTGAGIPPEDLPNIFDRFYQSNDSIAKAGGTGIGLALTRELVKLLGGNISVSSKVGEGSTFSIILPIHQKAAPLSPDSQLEVGNWQSAVGSAQQPTSPSPSTIHRLPSAVDRLPSTANRILIIEDNPDVVEYLSGCLEGDYQLQFAYNGRAGIDQALESIPDIIISDVMMPEKDGFEVCETLKNDHRSSHIPIVMLTAKADMDSRIAGLKRGADAYLKKPFYQQELTVVLQNLLENRRKLQAKYGEMNFDSGKDTDANSQSVDALTLENEFLQKVKSVVEEKLAEPNFSMNHLERALGLSRSQLFRKIKALTGKSPSAFIRSIRLHHAHQMLQTADMNVSEVAYAVGFSTPAYFSTAFLEEFGVQPGSLKS